MILTTRPILFYVFKSRFQDPQTDGSVASRMPSPMTSALAEACMHAARSSNSLLTQLWIEGSIATFGYFDSQYLFSSTIILMMSLVLHSSSGNNSRAEADRDAVETATDMLQSMVEDGNLPAAGFYQHLLELRKCFDFSPEGGNGNGKQFCRLAGRLAPLTGDNVNNNNNNNVNGTDVAPDVGVQGGGGVGADEVTDFSAMQMTVLDDPSIQNFLTQPDIHWGLPGVLESSGDVMSMSRWIFE